VTVDPRWTVHGALGWIRPRWTERKAAQAFAPICEVHAGWAELFFVVLGLIFNSFVDFGPD
jgi:hypothetical protein